MRAIDRATLPCGSSRGGGLAARPRRMSAARAVNESRAPGNTGGRLVRIPEAFSNRTPHELYTAGEWDLLSVVVLLA